MSGKPRLKSELKATYAALVYPVKTEGHTHSIGLPSQKDGDLCRAVDCPSFLDVPSKESTLKQGLSNCFRERQI